MDGISTERNFKKAVEWLEKGDKAGNLECTFQLTMHIMNGDGIEEDANKYFMYMQKAAKGGYKEAFVRLGDCYRYGIGTQQMVIMLLSGIKSIRFSLDGIASLAKCYTYGIGIQRDDKKAIELYKIAAEQGHAQAQFDLGICYRQGEGVEKIHRRLLNGILKLQNKDMETLYAILESCMKME